MNKLKEIIKIAQIHVTRIEWAMAKLKESFPLKKNDILDLSDQELLLIELLVSRFAKLQDFIGNKIINEFLRSTQDYTDNLTMLDKLNKLERIEIIETVDIWEEMREVRNHITHEYPDEPALTAKYLNQIFDLTPKLLDIFNRIKTRIDSK